MNEWNPLGPRLSPASWQTLWKDFVQELELVVSLWRRAGPRSCRKGKRKPAYKKDELYSFGRSSLEAENISISGLLFGSRFLSRYSYSNAQSLAWVSLPFKKWFLG